MFGIKPSSDSIKKQLRRLHEDLIEKCFTQDMKELVRTKSFFAGGAIRDLQRNRVPKDYDLFFYTEADKELFLIEVKNNFAFKASKINNFNIDINGKKVQMITLTCGMPDELVKTFDFTINTGVYCPQMDLLKLGPDSDELIVCEKILSPLNALVRTVKFQKSGYEVTPMTLINLGIAVSKMEPLETEEDVKDALKGISASALMNQDTIPF